MEMEAGDVEDAVDRVLRLVVLDQLAKTALVLVARLAEHAQSPALFVK
ncbi:MAG: hypothetical protein R3F16_17010 [Myxococcota bacterium]